MWLLWKSIFQWSHFEVTHRRCSFGDSEISLSSALHQKTTTLTPLEIEVFQTGFYWLLFNKLHFQNKHSSSWLHWENVDNTQYACNWWNVANTEPPPSKLICFHMPLQIYPLWNNVDLDFLKAYIRFFCQAETRKTPKCRISQFWQSLHSSAQTKSEISKSSKTQKWSSLKIIKVTAGKKYEGNANELIIQLLEYSKTSPSSSPSAPSPPWRYLRNQAWYQRSAGGKTTGKNSE